MSKNLWLLRRYKQEKAFNKNKPIFSDDKEKHEYIKNEMEVEPDNFYKKLLAKSIFTS